MSEDNSQKTELPSHKRLEDAKKEGKVVHSKEVNNFILFCIFALIINWVMPYVAERSKNLLSQYISYPHLFHLDGAGVISLFKQLLKDFLFFILFLLVLGTTGTIASNFIQQSIVFSPNAIDFNLSRISILQGIKRIFSLNSVFELVKGLIKITIIGTVIYMATEPELTVFINTQFLGSISILYTLLKVVYKMLLAICISMFFIAIIDYLYQRHTLIKSLMMTKQELKDEHKQTEGSPEIKNKIRALRKKMARQRMMSAVPKADVIITNPTHYAVALQYQPEKHEAPVVVAKGKDHLALKIREIAKKHDVEIVENPPLARSLFDNTDIDQPIPYEHYKAVAEIISYIMKLRYFK